jgi:hypothetical protein
MYGWRVFTLGGRSGWIRSCPGVVVPGSAVDQRGLVDAGSGLVVVVVNEVTNGRPGVNVVKLCFPAKLTKGHVKYLSRLYCLV